MEPSAGTIYELMNTPELTHKGEGLVWFGGVFICILNILSILFADELFRWNLMFQIQKCRRCQTVRLADRRTIHKLDAPGACGTDRLYYRAAMSKSPPVFPPEDSFSAFVFLTPAVPVLLLPGPSSVVYFSSFAFSSSIFACRRFAVRTSHCSAFR